VAEYHRVLAQHSSEELPYLRALVAEMVTGRPQTFTGKVRTVLEGIAVERGEDPATVAKLIDEAGISEAPTPR